MPKSWGSNNAWFYADLEFLKAVCPYLILLTPACIINVSNAGAATEVYSTGEMFSEQDSKKELFPHWA